MKTLLPSSHFSSPLSLSYIVLFPSLSFSLSLPILPLSLPPLPPYPPSLSSLSLPSLSLSSLPLTSPSPLPQVGEDKARPALSLVGYEDELRPAMAFVFGSTFICDTLHIAKQVPLTDCMACTLHCGPESSIFQGIFLEKTSGPLEIKPRIILCHCVRCTALHSLFRPPFQRLHLTKE